MIKKQYIFTGIIVAGAIGLTIIITSIFSGSKKPDKKMYEALQEQYEIRINEWKDRAANEVSFRLEQNQLFERYIYNDSVLKAQFINNQAKYIPLNNRLNDIPKNISRIAGNDDSIRAAFARE